jgi:heme-degrading monooxygenase HmoA
MRSLLSLVLCVAMLGGCAAVCPREGEAGRVNHVVLVWLKDDTDPAAAAAAIERASHEMRRQIPGIRRVEVGPSLPTTRPNVDASYDIAVIMQFDDEAALRAYETHPHHRAAVRDVLAPVSKRVLIYDQRIGLDEK